MIKKLSILCASLVIAQATTLQLPKVLDPKQQVDSTQETLASTPFKRTGPTIQIAILLDSSNSMDGLIAQTKTQIWDIINALALANKNNKDVTLQVALYEYGKSSIASSKGYIQKLSPLTNDLDFLSERLFNLRTNGGSEFAGWVIDDARKELQWSKHPDDLKLIIIAGNESFAQGNKPYQETIAMAKKEKIIVNTIYCGDKNRGINEHWQDGATLGGGVYMNIDSNKRVQAIKTPFDAKIVKLGASLNRTYVGYGNNGVKYAKRQMVQDSNAKAISPSSSVARHITKASKNYKASSWDIVSAFEENEAVVENVAALPAEYKGKSTAVIKKEIQAKIVQRKGIQKEIAALQVKRLEYIKNNKPAEQKDFGSVLIKNLKKIAVQNGYTFKK